MNSRNTRANKSHLNGVQARIKKKLSTHLSALGFDKNKQGYISPPSDKKKIIRKLHRKQKSDLLKNEMPFIRSRYDELIQYFASGVEVIPQKVSPRLELIESNTWQSDLFRLASLTWSVPVSRGYGRRIRFLVWDDFNGKLIGLFALGDPVFNSRVRDEYIGWSSHDRKKRLVNCMDAYVVGAIPPYNFLLCGKMIACLIRTKEVRRAFRVKYGNRKGIISRKHKNASLSLVTTSSALGRSSVYNRLQLDGIKYFEPIGFTEGWGHFHIPNSLFNDLRTYLTAIDHPYADGHEYGSGSNWKLRVTRAALESMGLNGDVLRHGVFREVYACKFIENYSSLLTGKSTIPRYRSLKSVSEVGAAALQRWLIPRAERRPQYLYWKKTDLAKLLSRKHSHHISLNIPRQSGIKRELKKSHQGLTREFQKLLIENIKRLPNSESHLETLRI